MATVVGGRTGHVIVTQAVEMGWPRAIRAVLGIEMKPVLIMVAVALAGVAFSAQAHAVPTVSPVGQPVATPTPTSGGARPTFLPGQPPVPAQPLPNTSTNAQSAPFSVCGTIVEFLSGPGDPRYVIALTTTTQARTRVRLVSQGTAPAGLGDQFRLGKPEVVAISGTAGVPNSATPDATTLREFTVTRVASCTMPNTSTNADSAPSGVRSLPNTSTSP